MFYCLCGLDMCNHIVNTWTVSLLSNPFIWVYRAELLVTRALFLQSRVSSCCLDISSRFIEPSSWFLKHTHTGTQSLWMIKYTSGSLFLFTGTDRLSRFSIANLIHLDKDSMCSSLTKDTYF